MIITVNKIFLVISLAPILMSMLRYDICQASESSISASRLASMETENCRALLKAALEARLEKHHNVDITSITRLDFYQGDTHMTSRSRGRVFRLLSLGSSYRLEGQLFLKSVPQGIDDSNWTIKSNSNYDKDSGIAKSFGQQNDHETAGGRISTERSDIIDLNPIPFFFDLELPGYMYGDEKTSLVRGLIASSDRWDIEFDTENNHVKIAYNFPLGWPLKDGGTELGTATFVATLDCSKGMMPIYAQCLYGSRGETDSWRRETHWLNNPKNVNGFWIPTEIVSEISTSSTESEYPGLRSVNTTQIIEFIQGQVKQSDLEVVFPEKARVRDFTRGVAYTVGADEKPITKEAPLYRFGNINPQPSSASASRSYLVWFTVAFVLLFGLLVIRKRLIERQTHPNA